MQKVDISAIPMVYLKSLVYDEMVKVEIAQKTIVELNEEIQKRKKVELAKNNESKNMEPTEETKNESAPVEETVEETTETTTTDAAESTEASA